MRFVDPTGMFDTEAEATKYMHDSDIDGKVEQGEDGLFYVNDAQNQVSYFRDKSAPGNTYGKGADGVVKCVLVAPETHYVLSSVGKLSDGLGGSASGMERCNGSFRLTNGKYNNSQISPRYYESNWKGGSRAKITTYNMAKSGKWLGRGTFFVSVAIGACDVYGAYEEDGGQIGVNTKRESTKTVGAIAGAWAGGELGAYVGGSIGLFVGGVGAVPGALIGGAVGGILGGIAGSDFGQFIANEIF